MASDRRVREIVARRGPRAVRVLAKEARDDVAKGRCGDAVRTLARAAYTAGESSQAGATRREINTMADELADIRDAIRRRCLIDRRFF